MPAGSDFAKYSDAVIDIGQRLEVLEQNAVAAALRKLETRIDAICDCVDMTQEAGSEHTKAK